MAAIGNALIVGAGIGGTTLAIALQRVGVDTHVAELHDTVLGVGIVCTGNTMRALREIGVLEECVDEGFPCENFQVFDSAGNFIMDNPMQEGAGPAYPTCIGMRRPIMSRILRDHATDLGSVIRTSLSVDRLDLGPTSVSVDFTDGTTGEYDMVVGADGVFSKVRNLMFGDRFQPEYVGQAAWRWPCRRHPDINTVTFFHGQRKLGFVPLSSDTMYALITDTIPGNPMIPEEQTARLFRERLEEYTAPIVVELREEITDTTQIIYRPFDDLLMPSPWHSGRAILIGDAAHAVTPHLGNGGGMAIEDAIVLADEIQRHEDLPAAFEAFMARRFERCRLVHDVSLQISQWEVHGGSDDGGYALSRETWAKLLEPY